MRRPLPVLEFTDCWAAGCSSSSSCRGRHSEVAAHLPAMARARRGRVECRSAGAGSNNWHVVRCMADAAGLGHGMAGMLLLTPYRGPLTADVMCTDFRCSCMNEDSVTPDHVSTLASLAAAGVAGLLCCRGICRVLRWYCGSYTARRGPESGVEGVQRRVTACADIKAPHSYVTACTGDR